MSYGEDHVEAAMSRGKVPPIVLEVARHLRVHMLGLGVEVSFSTCSRGHVTLHTVGHGMDLVIFRESPTGEVEWFGISNGWQPLAVGWQDEAAKVLMAGLRMVPG